MQQCICVILILTMREFSGKRSVNLVTEKLFVWLNGENLFEPILFNQHQSFKVVRLRKLDLRQK